MIYYFSGTGNSLDVARRMAALLGGDIRPLLLTEAVPVIPATPMLGLIIPVHNFDIPPAVAAWLRRAVTDGSPGQTYRYGLITYGGEEGNARRSLRRVMAEKGWPLAYTAMITVPDNAGPIIRRPYDLTSLYTLDDRLARVAEDIRRRRCRSDPAPFRRLTAFKTAAARLYLDSPVVAMRIDSSRCIRCGLCARLCPVENIYYEAAPAGAAARKRYGGRMKLRNRCIHCLACVHRCPTAAVGMGYIDFYRRQYRHPYVTDEELCRR